MSTPVKVALILALVLVPVAGVVGVSLFSDGGGAGAEGYEEITWKDLRGLDYKNGIKDDRVSAIDGQPIRIPGFVVPLEDDVHGASEFLLVPTPQACVHVPPPPPNQMVMVKMANGVTPPQRSWGPVWINGAIFVSTSDSGFGPISYLVRGEHAEPYRMTN